MSKRIRYFIAFTHSFKSTLGKCHPDSSNAVLSIQHLTFIFNMNTNIYSPVIFSARRDEKG